MGFFLDWLFQKTPRSIDAEIKDLENHIQYVLKSRLDAKIKTVDELRRLNSLPLDQLLNELKKVNFFKLKSLPPKAQAQLKAEIDVIFAEIDEADRLIQKKKQQRAQLNPAMA